MPRTRERGYDSEIPQPAVPRGPRARNLVLDGNPCHIEALEVARKVGVDFIVNSTFDKDMRVTGVFAGDLVAAHEAAVAKIKSYVQVSIEKPFDIVVTHAGYVGRNHYQTAKAAVGAEDALGPGSVLIMAADNCDCEPVGSPEYKTLIRPACASRRRRLHRRHLQSELAIHQGPVAAGDVGASIEKNRAWEPGLLR